MRKLHKVHKSLCCLTLLLLLSSVQQGVCRHFKGHHRGFWRQLRKAERHKNCHSSCIQGILKMHTPHTHTTKAELHIITKHTIICAVCVCLSQVLKKEGTVTPAANFCANGDAAVLEKAIKTKGGL